MYKNKFYMFLLLAGVEVLAMQEVASQAPLRDVLYVFSGSRDINAANGVLKQTPLHRAAAEGSVVLTTALITAKANVDARNSYGNTPLHNAANGEIVDILVDEGGADIEAKNRSKETPLLSLAGYGRVSAVKALLAKKPNIKEKARHNCTVLHSAVNAKDAECLRMLLEEKACDLELVDAKNEYDFTALDDAVECQKDEYAAILRQRIERLSLIAEEK